MTPVGTKIFILIIEVFLLSAINSKGLLREIGLVLLELGSGFS